jgi:hypothetical protein
MAKVSYGRHLPVGVTFAENGPQDATAITIGVEIAYSVNP